jgi:Fic family protein
MPPFDPKIPFTPAPLPPKIDLETPELMRSLLRARTELAELKGYSSGLPNPGLLLSPAVIKEAVASSEIEDINTTVADVLQNQLLPESERTVPDKEVLHYREAILWGYQALPTHALSTRLILGIKERLVPGLAHGYRRSQNAIMNSATGEVLYTPPIAAEVPRLIGQMEDFLHAAHGMDPLAASAIAHAQFEMIHPFEDGNGRTGRILMVLYLIEQGILQHPTLFISGYLIRNRKRYYDLLRAVSSDGAWEPFVRFMLEGFHEQGRETKELLVAMQEAFLRTKAEVKAALPKIFSADLVEAIFAYPVINPSKLGETLAVSYPSALKYLNALRDAGFLEDTRVGRFHLFANTRLLGILRGK